MPEHRPLRPKTPHQVAQLRLSRPEVQAAERMAKARPGRGSVDLAYMALCRLMGQGPANSGHPTREPEGLGFQLPGGRRVLLIAPPSRGGNAKLRLPARYAKAGPDQLLRLAHLAALFHLHEGHVVQLVGWIELADWHVRAWVPIAPKDLEPAMAMVTAERTVALPGPARFECRWCRGVFPRPPETPPHVPAICCEAEPCRAQMSLYVEALARRKAS